MITVSDAVWTRRINSVAAKSSWAWAETRLDSKSGQPVSTRCDWVDPGELGELTPITHVIPSRRRMNASLPLKHRAPSPPPSALLVEYRITAVCIIPWTCEFYFPVSRGLSHSQTKITSSQSCLNLMSFVLVMVLHCWIKTLSSFIGP